MQLFLDDFIFKRSGNSNWSRNKMYYLQLLETNMEVIHWGFFGWGGPRNVLGVHFSRDEQNFTIGWRPEFWGNFPKFCSQIIKNMKNYGENVRKMQRFAKIFCFCTRLKNRNYYIWAIMEFALGAHRCLKNQLQNCKNEDTFQYLTKIFRKFVQKQ